MLARHQADSIDDLETKIARGTVVEHPAWEDLIIFENLGARVEGLDAQLNTLHNAPVDRIN